MTKLVLSVHVLAAVLLIGPLAVATSLFPSSLRRAAAGDGSLLTVRLLHRVTRVYAVGSLVVPVFGMATAGRMNVITSPWLIASIALVVVGAALLVLVILPQQGRLLRTVEGSGAGAAPLGRTTFRLTVAVGIFNLIWALVTVLMIVRPGSTTGA